MRPRRSRVSLRARDQKRSVTRPARSYVPAKIEDIATATVNIKTAEKIRNMAYPQLWLFR